MKKIPAWECDYCGEVKYNMINIEFHERYCDHNPANRKCATCDYYKIKDNGIDSWYYCTNIVGQSPNSSVCDGWDNKKFLRKKKLDRII